MKINFKQFLEGSFNDDDWYLVDTEAKKVVRNIGGPSSRPDESFYLKKPSLAILKGMKAKHQGYKLNEEIKGWKNAGSDIAKFRKNARDAAKEVKLIRVNKGGVESKMHDAIKRFDTEADARAHHANMVKLNPTRGIKHNLYVGDKPELLEHSTGNHGEYANDVAEKTMVHAIINQLFGGAKTEENYDTVYSFLESDLASDFYDKYYKTFEEDSERRKARRMGDEVKQPTPANATLMGQFRKELPELYSKWKKTK